jgi:hypothetical protein
MVLKLKKMETLNWVPRFGHNIFQEFNDFFLLRENIWSNKLRVHLCDFRPSRDPSFKTKITVKRPYFDTLFSENSVFL